MDLLEIIEHLAVIARKYGNLPAKHIRIGNEETYLGEVEIAVIGVEDELILTVGLEGFSEQLDAGGSDSPANHLRIVKGLDGPQEEN